MSGIGKAGQLVSRLYRKANTQYRVRKAKSVMRRTLEESIVWIAIRVYDNCLQDEPRKSTRSQLKEITPVKPSWLNDYYVATALESLSKQGNVVKAKRYSVNSWPPKTEAYGFGTVSADSSASGEALRIETNNKCVVYQDFQYCPRPSRFERQHIAETVSPRETRFKTAFPLKDPALPCDLCWEKEDRARDIRMLVENIAKYDLAVIAIPEITGTNGELQEAVAETCINSPYAAEVKLIKPVVEKAIYIRQGQIARNTLRPEHGWLQGEGEELVATLEEYIKSQMAG